MTRLYTGEDGLKLNLVEEERYIFLRLKGINHKREQQIYECLCIGYTICGWYNVAHVYLGSNKHDEL